jgi:hypothetical protein
MPHVALVPFTGFRVREEAMRELGMTLPGLKQRAAEPFYLVPILALLKTHHLLPEGNPLRA